MHFQAEKIYTCAKGAYRAIQAVNEWSPNVWEAVSSHCMPRTHVLKTGKEASLKNEYKYLMAVEGHSQIRRLVDVIESPYSLVLEYMEENLRTLSLQRKLTRPEIKSVTRQVLQALNGMHARSIVHTDIKPQNILLSGIDHVNYGTEKLCVKLADLGGASPSSDHLITAKSFRSPKSWLGLSWGPPADIWSLAAVIATLLMGPGGELFGSSAETDDGKELEMLYRQDTVTGPIPKALLDRTSDKWRALVEECRQISSDQDQIMDLNSVIEQLEIAEEDGRFLRWMLTIDPEQRPTAQELLDDQCLNTEVNST